ncbi:methyltransferase domain-containing protein [Pseudoteredinibacter isoporae]|uniref:SAM-dependent methyltransferase n=1 Tax=Pseudoteredinibacter isoporae TaxID=570281 RepID=A0A7X0MW51_9GAMM|nr:SAM-dependent methyltransferase [Pseudoteredinibacter isoporae]NHO87365.1 class I SAM-dependent methyltransferase [Pseudoteredinibacter isoporae]NIB23189.1 class I SAM-dependent methyltransferase [Pseudoteredinibacter isoporae]
MQCPLCNQDQVEDFHKDKRRQYLRCEGCELIFVPENEILSPALEKAEYDKHQNQPDDSGYRRFLNRCLEPLLKQLETQGVKAPEDIVGLDFGCGPGPTLSRMAEERGYVLADYDPFYAHKPELLKAQYDFITMTEVIEHVRHPRLVLDLLDRLLAASGTLAIMTKRRTEPEHFASWHYKNDPTHIRFYHLKSFEFIARHYGWKLTIIDKDVLFLSRS